MSAMDLSFTPVFFGGSILLVPFCAAIVYASTQADEICSGFILPRAIRGSLNKYVFTKVCAAAITGFFALGTACLLHSILWHFLAGPYDVAARPDVEVFFAEGTVYDQLIKFPYAWPAYIHAAIGFGLTGAFWSVIALWIASIIPDTQLVVTTPVVLYFLWKGNFTGFLFGFELPDFTAFYNDGVTWPQYGLALGFHVLLLIVVVWGYRTALKRRICNA
ncbi:MAG: hypothetical protein RR816_03950 [Clostridia bacterium]